MNERSIGTNKQNEQQDEMKEVNDTNRTNKQINKNNKEILTELVNLPTFLCPRKTSQLSILPSQKHNIASNQSPCDPSQQLKIYVTLKHHA